MCRPKSAHDVTVEPVRDPLDLREHTLEAGVLGDTQAVLVLLVVQRVELTLILVARRAEVLLRVGEFLAAQRAPVLRHVVVVLLARAAKLVLLVGERRSTVVAPRLQVIRAGCTEASVRRGRHVPAAHHAVVLGLTALTTVVLAGLTAVGAQRAALVTARIAVVPRLVVRGIALLAPVTTAAVALIIRGVVAREQSPVLLVDRLLDRGHGGHTATRVVDLLPGAIIELLLEVGTDLNEAVLELLASERISTPDITGRELEAELVRVGTLPHHGLVDLRVNEARLCSCYCLDERVG